MQTHATIVINYQIQPALHYLASRCISTTCSLPVPWTQINGLSGPHILHDILNTPGLVLVPARIVRLKRILIPHVHALLQTLCRFLVVFVRVGFRVVRPDPFGQFRGCTAGVELDFVPVGVLQELGVGEAEFLGTGVSNESLGLC